MSLDVYLETIEFHPQSTAPQIWIREDGQNSQLTRAEWDARFPGREPVTVPPVPETHTVYSANITHNLGGMAEAVGLYVYLWRPEEAGITQAHQLVSVLRTGLDMLRSDPERFKGLNPANGWGSYRGLCAFVEEYLAACERYPDATVRVWR